MWWKCECGLEYSGNVGCVVVIMCSVCGMGRGMVGVWGVGKVYEVGVGWVLLVGCMWFGRVLASIGLCPSGWRTNFG